MVKVFAALLLALALSSCMIGPNYRRPPVKTPQSWRFEEAEALDVVNTPWWKQFDDPVLDGLIETALKENKDVLIAAARVEEFMGSYAVVRAAQFPQVSGTALPLREGVTQYTSPAWPPGTPHTFWSLQAFLSASWEMDLWGRVEARFGSRPCEPSGNRRGAAGGHSDSGDGGSDRVHRPVGP